MHAIKKFGWTAFAAMLGAAVTLGATGAFAQSAGCSDSFSVASLGEGKTWRFVAFDRSTVGTGSVADGKLTLAGRGRDIYGAKNDFVAAYRSDIQGDFDVSVKLESQDSTYDWAQAGIVVATDLNDLTKGGYVALDVSTGHGYTVFYDKTAPVGQLDGNSGAGKTKYPAWLRLAKKSMQYTAYYKTGVADAWTALPTPPPSLNTGANAQIGLFTVSHDTTKTSKSVFDDFTCIQGTSTALYGMRRALFAPGTPARTPTGMAAPEGGFLDALGKARQPAREFPGESATGLPVMIFRP